MMKIKEIKVKSAIVKSNLPGGGFVINPYIGCSHGCSYCYARFMKRFTGHKEEWGSFVDVKTNAHETIPKNTDRYRDRSIIIGSVCDPYQPIEKRYRITRKIIKKLIPLQPKLEILTKSDLVLRDVDLLGMFKEVTVVISLSTLNESHRRILENATSATRRMDALRELHEHGIKTVLFISPILPGLTDWEEMILTTKGFVDGYWFENLNLYLSIKKNIFDFLNKINHKLIDRYKEIYSNSEYWKREERRIRMFCDEKKVEYHVYFHHKK
jgi:DNA repair photolyase